jgi:hypothetical protein
MSIPDEFEARRLNVWPATPVKRYVAVGKPSMMQELLLDSESVITFPHAIVLPVHWALRYPEKTTMSRAT